LLCLRWKLTFLLKTESRCEFCKSIFKICHALSKLSVDVSYFSMNACNVSSRFLLGVEHKEVHIHENFRNYGVLEMVAVKFVHYCYHSSNWNLGDFSN
jgi:hypothetical protein